jgi:hypothetical protein
MTHAQRAGKLADIRLPDCGRTRRGMGQNKCAGQPGKLADQVFGDALGKVATIVVVIAALREWKHCQRRSGLRFRVGAIRRFAARPGHAHQRDGHASSQHDAGRNELSASAA